MLCALLALVAWLALVALVAWLALLALCALLVLIGLVALMYHILGPQHLGLQTHWQWQGPHYSNVEEMGNVLFTQYLYPFELAAALLLVAIISAIALAFRGPKPHKKTQSMSEQLKATKANRLRVVNLKSEKGE